MKTANNSPKVDELKDFMASLSINRAWDGLEFNLNKTVKLNYRLMKIAFLKSGFLLLTAMLGFKYAFDKRLSAVREQILSPEEDLLSNCFWIVPEKSQPFPKRRIILVSDPLPLFLVTYDNCAVILPNPSSPQNLYEIIRNEWDQEQSVNFTGKVYEWPEKALMALDCNN